jgi:hypothetical protein
MSYERNPKEVFSSLQKKDNNEEMDLSVANVDNMDPYELLKVIEAASNGEISCDGNNDAFVQWKQLTS